MRQVPARRLQPGDVLDRGSNGPATVEFVEIHPKAVWGTGARGAVIVRYRGAETCDGLGWESYKPEDSVSLR